MEKRIKVIGIISLILGIISFIWLFFNFIAFEQIRPIVIHFKPLGIVEQLAKYIFIGFIVSFFFHLVSFIGIIYQFQY